MSRPEVPVSLEWEYIPYDFDRCNRSLIAGFKIWHYKRVLDYDRDHNTLSDEQRAKVKRLIVLWTEVYNTLQ